METITFNTAAKARRVVKNNTEYLVAPLTLIVSGVLHGNRGPVYYPPEEIAKNPSDWNGTPITVYHPQVDGEFVSAQYPGILEASGIGFLDNAKAENGKLKAEGWFEAERVRTIDVRIYNALTTGKVMELSTGLSAEHEVALANSKDSKGRAYTVIARNYQPDHLAVLPDQRGACSVDDGCGVLVNMGYHHAQPSCVCNGTCLHCSTTRQRTSNSHGYLEFVMNQGAAWYDSAPVLFSACRKQESVKPMPASTTTTHHATNSPTLAGQDNGGWSNVVNYDISLQDRYRQLDNIVGEMSGGMAYLTDVYNDYVVYRWKGKTYRLNYTEQDGTCVLADEDPVEVQRMTVYEPINNTTGGWDMALNAQQRAEIINDLTTNCDCWKGQGDKDILNSMPDEKLVQLKTHADKDRQAIAVANTAVHGFSDGTSAYRINPETGRWERREVPAPQPSQQRRNPNPAPAPAPTTNANNDDDLNDDPAPVPVPRRQVPAASTTNAKRDQDRPRTMEDWVRAAPPDVQNTFRYAKSIEDREKESIINKLLVNVAETERPAHRERLQRRSLDDLHNDLALVPKVQPVEGQQNAQQQPNQSNGKRRNGTTNGAPVREELSDMLTLPTINWQEMGNGTNNASTSQQVQDGLMNTAMDDLSEDDWLRTAPPSLRNRVMNALVIEDRERRKLIDELTANMTDDEAQQRVANRLEKKTLEELRDLLALRPRQETARTNYFGSSSGTTANQARPNEHTEDVLPLPTINWNS